MNDSNYNSTGATTSGVTGSNTAVTDSDDQHSLATYVSDLLALEQHIGQPLGTQIASDATARYPEALALVQELKTLNESHVASLQSTLDTLGGHAASPIKSAWASLLGGAASAIGSSRKTKVTKWLRDDYTALSLATMSYTLLHATAIGMGDMATAEIARTGLADYARSVMKINQAVPGVVLGELREDGVNVAPSAADTIRSQTESVWRGESRSLHGSN